MKILHITCSARGQQSVSYRLSQRVMERLLSQHPAAQIVTRDLWAEPLPHIDGEYAAVLGGTRDRVSAAAARGLSSLALSDRLIAELRDADCVVIATPMHNFTVPSVLKAWLDHVVRIGVTFNATPEGKIGTLADRPVYIAVSSGGYRTGERARQPDFLEPYLRAILPTIGLKNLNFVSVQATAFGPEATTAAFAAVEEALDDCVA
ncbi:FMN-dependent NADH-azoreductase AzoR [Janthinobacterium sp. HH01]|uniref:FMN-dependent NADH-azoreductase n=1 Tax=Janthinobacterium sp. HH01 TaxID=1198452 RepID=UPI0002AEB271|nr:NAD(P)H-dependent oxidoreductase [Janthinobacterium sp. HH01]ELX11823.1 FMN-dependent NADH-azoreductase AzoR [Janthinobacterium sp. HH01]